MKWNVEGFDQAGMVAAGMDAADAVLLRWVIDMMASGSVVWREIDGRLYYWIRYQPLIDDLPILRITSRDVLARRLAAMVEAKVLAHRHVTERGSFSYYGTGPAYESLVRKLSTGCTPGADPSDPKVGGVRPESRSPSDPKVGTNDPSPIHPSTKTRGFATAGVERQELRFRLRKCPTGHENRHTGPDCLTCGKELPR